MSPSRPPVLPDPGSGPRLARSGRQERDRPVLHREAGSRADRTQWEVTVTPLVATTIDGRDVNPAARAGGPAPTRPRAVFEVRAAFYGPCRPEFRSESGPAPLTRRVEQTHTSDLELARAIARAATEMLEPGRRELDIVSLAREVERRRT